MDLVIMQRQELQLVILGYFVVFLTMPADSQTLPPEGFSEALDSIPIDIEFQVLDSVGTFEDFDSTFNSTDIQVENFLGFLVPSENETAAPLRVLRPSNIQAAGFLGDSLQTINDVFGQTVFGGGTGNAIDVNRQLDTTAFNTAKCYGFGCIANAGNLEIRSGSRSADYSAPNSNINVVINTVGPNNFAICRPVENCLANDGQLVIYEDELPGRQNT
eukprot:TRINITY_DN1341_c0_g3_i2.p3 TRINITY_DN1341_c0_g3~~TRINITY_DN1341_c0_g3_i2.p3  ORF type:complete len:217 (-),score=19.92 TRINITY_DN1341_c0_g3_i2:1870-2520(-)